MLPFGKISQMSRAIVQKSHHACSHVPLTTAFDCASPNSRINNILNQWYYMQQEEKKIKDRIKAEKARKLKAKYEVRLLPDYSKKIEKEPEKAVAKYSKRLDPYVKTLEYITTETNRRVSPEFLALLQRQNKREILGKRMMEPLRAIKIKQNEFDFDGNETVRQLERVNPQLAKYLRENMERQDLMTEMYDINFYDTTDPRSLKHIFNALNKRGPTKLSPEQLAKLNKFLQMSSQQSPEDFERHLMSLKSDGFLTGPMVDYLHKLLNQNSGNLTGEHLRRQLAALQKIDKQFETYNRMSGHSLSFSQQDHAGGRWNASLGKTDERWNSSLGQTDGRWNASPRYADGHWNALPGQKSGHWRELLSFTQQGTWDPSQKQEKRGRWNFLNEINGSQYPGSDGLRKNKGKSGYRYSYDYQQNAQLPGRGHYGKSYAVDYQSGRAAQWDSGKARTNKANPYRFSGDESDRFQNRRGSRQHPNFSGSEKLFNVHSYSFDNTNRFPGIFDTHGKTRNYFRDDTMQRKTDKYEKQYFQLLSGPKGGTDDDIEQDMAGKTQYYVRRPWERTPIPKMKRTKLEPTIVEKKRIEPYKLPPPKDKNQPDEPNIINEDEDIRPLKQVTLMFTPHTRKTEAPSLPNRNRKASVVDERFADHGYLEPPKMDQKALQKFLSSTSTVRIKTVAKQK